MDTPKQRVAVLGGGLGAISAAYYLTSTPELRSKYDVTIYTQGWRLGGKGASGRNAAMGQRIEEHGLHAFLGFYENAFRTMRAAYAEWQKAPDNPFQSWTDAFEPQRQVTLAESPDEAGVWKTWTLDIPTLPGEPGEGAARKGVAEHLAALLAFLRDHASASRGTHAALDVARELSEGHAQPARSRELVALLGRLDAALDARSLAGDVDDALRRVLTVLDIGCAAAKGIVTDVLPGGGYQAIDDWDFKEWLEHHGCSRVHAWAAPVRVLYTLGFAFVEGREGRDNARASAGVALKVAVELLLGSRGAPLWKMRSGMGDTIFSPLYEILARQRGVRVEFFRRVKSLGLSADRASVATIELSRQVDLAPGVARYEPLVPIPVEGGTRVLPCWPSEPHWGQIADGQAIAARLAEKHLTLESAWCQQEVGKETLRVGEHFDLVVLGISIAELPHLCGELATASPAWQSMLEGIATVQTHAFQLWLSPTLEALGWKSGTTIMTGYAEPFDTWGDMSHLVPMEAWPPANAPQTIAYFCAAKREPEHTPPFDDSSFPRSQYELTRKAAEDFSAWRLGLVWPRGVVERGKRPLDCDLLVAPAGGSATERFAQQYFRANIDPSERYVLSVPGTTKLRLGAGASGFGNLYLAGDWIRTSMMAGCAEAGIESGMRASKAISGVPADISGDWT